MPLVLDCPSNLTVDFFILISYRMGTLITFKTSSNNYANETITLNSEEEVPFCHLQLSSLKNIGEDTTTISKKNKTMSRRCLCDTIKPIIWLAQYLGIIPLTLIHPLNDNGKRTGACQLVFKWKSGATIFGTVLLIFFLMINPFAHVQIRNRMSAIFSKTDLYAFTFQTYAMVLETTVIISAGRLNKEKFTKGWAALNTVFHDICDSAGDLRRIKVCSYVVFLLIHIQFISFFTFMFRTSYRSIGVYESCFALLIGTLIITLTLIIPFILSASFLFVCTLIRSHFLKISEMLETVVAKPKLTSPKLYTRIDAMRVLHEQLCQAVGFFEGFFGVQVLLTLCTGCFTVTIGAYACILQGEGIFSPLAREIMGAWGMQLYSAGIFMLMIVISGQLVTNAAASPAPILNAIPLAELDIKSQIQVTAFLHKIAAFPTKMSAMKITNVSTTFLASAATNITTYLLVLMQFKLSFETSEENENRNTTVNTNATGGGILTSWFY